MSEPETPYFRLSPEAPGTEPAGFDSHTAEEVGELSPFGRQMALLLEIAGPWTGDHAPNFSDLLAVVLRKYHDLEAETATLATQVDEWAAGADELAQHLAALTLAVEALTARAERAEAQEKRLYPLVRYQRAELHEAKLISNQEYADLAAVGGSHILDTYDELRTRALKAEESVLRLKVELAEQEVDKLDLIVERVNARAELTRLKDAIRTASSTKTAGKEIVACAQSATGVDVFRAGQTIGRTSLAQDLLNLFDL